MNIKGYAKQLLGESAIYGISGMLSRFISIFLVPLYTSVLSTEEYGKLSLVNSTFYFVAVVAVFAMDSSAARWYYDEQDDELRKPIIATWFWFQLMSSVALAIILTVLSPLLSNTILHQADHNMLFIIPASGLLASILPTIVTNWLRFQRKPIHTVVFTISTVLLTVGFNFLFVVYLKQGIAGILLATVCTNLLASLYVLAIMKRWLLLRYFSKQKLIEMLRYAYPLIPTAFAFWILNSSSSFVINKFHGQGAVGLFQIGSMIASGAGMVAGAFQMAWGPFVFSMLDKPEAKRVISFVFTGYTWLMSTLALSIALFAKEILILFTNPGYYGSATVAGVLSFNSIIYGFAYIAVVGCNVQKDNKPLAYSILFAAIITGLLYWFLVPAYGGVGAALSSALGYLIVPIYLFYKSQQYWPVPFRFTLNIILFLLAVLFFVVSQFLPQTNLSTAIIYKILTILCFIFSACFVIFAGYKTEITQWLRQRADTKKIHV